MGKMWRRIFVGVETPLNDLSADDADNLKKLGVRYLKVKVDIPEEQLSKLPRLANKYSGDIIDRCTIVGIEQKDVSEPGYIIFDLNYKSTTVFIDKIE